MTEPAGMAHLVKAPVSISAGARCVTPVGSRGTWFKSGGLCTNLTGVRSRQVYRVDRELEQVGLGGYMSELGEKESLRGLFRT